jgi:YHS domain-containing protein
MDCSPRWAWSRPGRDRGDIFGTVTVNYKLFLNALGLAVFGGLFWLTQRRGASDPVCGMKVDTTKAIRKDLGAETFYFCSEHCLHAFESKSEGDEDPRLTKATRTAP